MESQNRLYKVPQFLGVVLISVSIVGCSLFNDDDDGEFEDGVHVEIREFIDDETMSIIEDSLNVTVHRGDNPPDISAIMGSGQQRVSTQSDRPMAGSIEGITVVMSPFIRIETLVPDDPIDDDGFLDYYIQLYNQDMDDFAIDIDMMHPNREPRVGEGSFIIGDDNDFTVFSELIQELSDEEGAEIVTTQVFSGTATSEGVEDANIALMMLDNAGLEDRFIPDGTGRSFEDGAGIARITSWPEDASKVATDKSQLPAPLMMMKRKNN